MRLPWVARLAYEASQSALGVAQDHARDWRAAYERERATVQALTEQIIALRREHFDAPPVAPEVVPPTPLPDDVGRILARFTDDKLRGRLAVKARELLALGVKPEDVAKRLWAGQEIAA